MISKSIHLFILLLCTTFIFETKVYAQIILKSTVVFTNNNDSLRNVKNISDPISRTQATNASFVQMNRSNFGNVILLTDSLLIQIEPAVPSYKDGQFFSFISTFTNTGSLLAATPNLGYFQILKSDGNPLDSAEIIPGMTVTLVYFSNTFRVVSGLYKPCKNGSMGINENFCIESNERTADTFWNAIKTCGDNDGRLCKWNEWYIACYENTGNLLNMNNNWEWIDDAANNQNHAKLVGNASCTEGTHVLPTSLYTYRCCYTR